MFATISAKKHDFRIVFIRIWLYSSFMCYWYYLYLFANSSVQHDIHIRWCSCRL